MVLPELSGLPSAVVRPALSWSGLPVHQGCPTEDKQRDAFY